MVVETAEAHLHLAGGATALIVAARCGDVKTTALLAEMHNDVQDVDSAGRNIMHNAVLCENIPVLEWALTETDIDTKATDIHSLNIAHLAAITTDCQCSGQVLSDQVGDNAVAQ